MYLLHIFPLIFIFDIALILGDDASFCANPEIDQGEDKSDLQVPTSDINCPILPDRKHSASLDCGLYLAESSIVGAGWGTYNGPKEIPKGERILPIDVALQITGSSPRSEALPAPLIHEYYWETIGLALFETDIGKSTTLLPGFGMASNSHMGMVNAHNEGVKDRVDENTGAQSHQQNVTFSAAVDIPAFHEIFVNYGDNYFEYRVDKLGVIPLSDDFKKADEVIDLWKNLNYSTSITDDLYDLVRQVVSLVGTRLQLAFPDSADIARQTLTAAHASVRNVTRSKEWLDGNGLCLDHIQVGDSTVAGKGAFASRYLPKGTIVAPLPVLHLHRGHLETAAQDKDGNILWQGHQLLLNYCFGHKESSLLFFPYTPAVNLINHSPSPNVAIKRSRHSRKEYMHMTTDKLISNNHRTGIVFELIALRGIDQGEEILLDYGDDWQWAYDRHHLYWKTHERTPASVFNNAVELLTEDELPPYIVTRCYIDLDQLLEPDELGWHEVESLSSELEETLACRVISANFQGDKRVSYNVILTQSGTKVRDVPWNGIEYIDKEYSLPQYNRGSFRHEIMLPDDMVPSNWRDLKEKDEPVCGLYMAESAIPNSGLGMYTSITIKEGDPIFYDDLVIQVEDFELNQKLRQWFHNLSQIDAMENRPWLLDNYYWSPTQSGGDLEASDVQSIMPGTLSSLANSHPGLVNADLRSPVRRTTLHRALDPGVGASTSYHGVHFIARGDIEAGNELFVGYGDNWFQEREDLNTVPLSWHYRKADEILERFNSLVNNDITTKIAKELWSIILSIFQYVPSRQLNSLPREVEDVEHATLVGSAAYSVPNRLRSDYWLQSNGRCLDNIKPGPSSNRQAGRGAFATRKLFKGDLIAPLPLVHLRRRHMEIYDSENIEDPNSFIWRDGTQLLLNYCYGHAESSLLFLPYAPVVNYINHNYTDYNGVLQWSTLSNHRTDWLNLTPDELEFNQHAGLILEIVATRDVEEGEEIFLNYGDRWERAWNDYVDQWRPPTGFEEYIPPDVLNDRTEWVKTTDEDPYTGLNLITVCYLPPISKAVKRDDIGSLGEVLWAEVPDMYNDSENLYPCEIIERHGEYDDALRDSIKMADITYTARVEHRVGDILLKEIPRYAIKFWDQKYSSDMFLRSAFRQEIEIPDHLVPIAWRDIST